MISWRLRPSFRQELPYASSVAQERIAAHVRLNHAAFEVKSFPNFTCLRIPHAERHFWSPRLNVSFQEVETGQTRVQGTFGPNANVWALYLYGYLITGTVGMFSGIFGGCQLALGMPAWGMTVFAATLALAIALFLASLLGQRLAAPQSKELEEIYVQAIGQEVEIS